MGTKAPIAFHSGSEAASDFGSGFGSGGYFVFIAGDGEACLTLQQVRANNGRTVLWIEWGDDQPQSVSVGDPSVSVQLFVEDGSGNYATPTSGSVTVSQFVRGDHIDGSYLLAFEGGIVLSGGFQTPQCPQQCWP